MAVQATYRQMTPSDPFVIEAFGRVFKAGEAVELDDRFRDKVAGNPSFQLAGEQTYGDEAAKAGGMSPDDALLAREAQKLADEQRKAEAKAAPVNAELDAKKRAREQVQALTSARSNAADEV